MKSERRHDLETNELVTWLEKFKPYVGQATAIVAVLVAVFAIRSIWNNDSAEREQAAWDAFAYASDTSDPEMMGLLGVADDDKYAGTSMPEWAHVTWADRQLQLAAQAYLADRPAALTRLEKIEGIYSALADGASDREVQNRAAFGLARVYELQNKLDEAKTQYAKVQGDLITLATQRATQLDSPDVQEACAWLATAELPRPSSAGTPGGRPSFDAQVPAAGGEGFDPKTLEDLLGNLAKETEASDDRYSEEAEDAGEEETSSEDESDSAEEAPASDESAADSTEAEAPAETVEEESAEESSEAEAAGEATEEAPVEAATEATEGE